MKIEIIYELYKDSLMDLSIGVDEAMEFLQRCVDGNVPAEGIGEILATHRALISGQDGDRGLKRTFENAENALNDANTDNFNNDLPTCEPTEADEKMKIQAYKGADIVANAHYELGKFGEFSSATIDSIINYGIAQVEDSAQ